MRRRLGNHQSSNEHFMAQKRSVMYESARHGPKIPGKIADPCAAGPALAHRAEPPTHRIPNQPHELRPNGAHDAPAPFARALLSSTISPNTVPPQIPPAPELGTRATTQPESESE